MIALLPAALAAVLPAAPAAPATMFATAAVVSIQPAGWPHLMFAWKPGAAQCDGVAVMPVTMRPPGAALVWQQPEGAGTVTYRFRIDAAGRPLSIARDGGFYTPYLEDIAPALAASRFAAGGERSGCAITYTARSTAIADAPVADLTAYAVGPTANPLPPALWNRIMPAGSDCRVAPGPRIRLRAYPDLAALPATPGDRNWSMVGYDLDARGRPIRVRTVAGTREPALDVAAIRAMAASRFTAGARRGCLYPYRRAAGTLAPPPLPDRIGGVATTEHCAAGDWADRPTPFYPTAWNRRRIEGWAVIAFDVAPWGEIGNVRAIASEPAAEFGQAAIQLLRGARKPASTTGHVGCIERVRFAMPARATAADPPAADD